MTFQRDKEFDQLLVAVAEIRAQLEAQQIAMEVLVHSICSETGLSASKFLDTLQSARDELAIGLGDGSQLVGAFLQVQDRLEHLLLAPEAEQS